MGDMASEKTAFTKVILALLYNANLRRATAYLSTTETVKATRQCRFRLRDRQETFLLTIGQPNFLERRFIRQCVKSGEPFPVKKIQVQRWPAKKRT